MHQSQRFAVIIYGVSQGATTKRLEPWAGNRLDTDSRCIGETDFFYPHLLLQKRNNTPNLIAFGLPLNTGVNIFGVLPKNRHLSRTGVF